MRTALDTNVLSALWFQEPFAVNVAQNLGSARGEGGLVIGAPVYAELLAYPKATESFVSDFLADTGITVDFELQKAVWVEAGRRYARYARRRRSSDQPKRLLVDFVIGSHALTQADRLMTLDPKRYRRDFPDLDLFQLRRMLPPFETE